VSLGALGPSGSNGAKISAGEWILSEKQAFLCFLVCFCFCGILNSGMGGILKKEEKRLGTMVFVWFVLMIFVPLCALENGGSNGVKNSVW
jgi:hypothetical protein